MAKITIFALLESVLWNLDFTHITQDTPRLSGFLRLFHKTDSSPLISSGL